MQKNNSKPPKTVTQNPFSLAPNPFECQTQVKFTQHQLDKCNCLANGSHYSSHTLDTWKVKCNITHEELKIERIKKLLINKQSNEKLNRRENH